MGPNGNGKSTLVSAIVLAMGGKPKLLCRSSNIQDYIKNGKNEASIEVHIYKNIKKDLIKFNRVIHSNGKSSWFIDGKQFKEKEYLQQVGVFNIQIDNLCQFLPQDRVQDFAKMNPHEILLNTQKSVLQPDMIEKFEKLKQLRKLQLTSKKSISDNEIQLKDAEARFKSLESAVDLIAIRKSMIKKIEIMKSKKIWLNCLKLKEDSKTIKKDLEQQIKFVKRDEKKLNEEKINVENYDKQINDIFKKQKEIEENFEKSIIECSNFDKEINKLNNQIRQKKHALLLKKQHEDEREDRFNKANSILQLYIHDLAENQKTAGLPEEQNRMKQLLVTESEKLATEKEKLMEQLREVNNTLDDTYQPKLQYVKKKLSDLEDIPTKKLNIIRNIKEDVFKAVRWLKQNRHQFEGQIYEPMLLELNVKNAEHAKYLENSIPVRDLIAFTCTNKNDVDLLTRKLRNDQNLLVNVIYSEAAESCSYEPSVGIDHYRKFGFYSYLIDLIEGPAPILNYLCAAYRFHETLIGTEKVDKYADDLPNNIYVFFGGNYKFSVIISKYSNEKSSLREEINSRNLFGLTINKTELTQLKSELLDITKRSDLLKNRRTEIEAKISLINEQRKEVFNKKHKFEYLISHVQSLSEKVKIQKRKVEEIRNEPKLNIDQEESNLKQFVKQLIKQMFQIHKNKLRKLDKIEDLYCYIECYREILNKLKEEKYIFEQKVVDAQQAWRNTKETYEAIKLNFENCNKQYNNKINTLKELCNGTTPDDDNFPFNKQYEKLPDHIDDIDDKIAETQSRIDCTKEGDSENILQKFEDTKQLIERLKNSISNDTKDDNKIENEMIELHDKWYPVLMEKIEVINENFSKFMCSMEFAGEIQLDRINERDYDDYGIKILVKYRNNTQLKALDRFVQSGGERTVAIAAYTLSLQSITNVPFRCVDEINQGMDRDNEKKIFNMIVKETSTPTSPQYFFVTPKINRNFDFNNNGKLICVMNGSNLIKTRIDSIF